MHCQYLGQDHFMYFPFVKHTESFNEPSVILYDANNVNSDIV